MNPLLCVIPFCHKDAVAAEELLKWIGELDAKLKHPCLLVADSKVDQRQRAFIKIKAESIFSHVQEIEFKEPPSPQILKWPLWRYFANQMFATAARHIFDNCRLPFLWLEADAVPMRSGWLDEIAESYYSQPMKFHGPLIPAMDNRPAHIPAWHMAGVAVYPATAYFVLEKYFSGEHTWDMGGSEVVIPKASKCRLISHNYGTSEEDGWRFKVEDGKIIADHPTQSYKIREDAAVFHRCDDDSLIRALRELRIANIPRPKALECELEIPPASATEIFKATEPSSFRSRLKQRIVEAVT